MTVGAGKYDEICTEVRERLDADGVVLMVFGGINGQGFAAQLPMAVLKILPDLMRQMADEMQSDFDKGKF